MTISILSNLLGGSHGGVSGNSGAYTNPRCNCSCSSFTDSSVFSGNSLQQAPTQSLGNIFSSLSGNVQGGSSPQGSSVNPGDSNSHLLQRHGLSPITTSSSSSSQGGQSGGLLGGLLSNKLGLLGGIFNGLTGKLTGTGHGGGLLGGKSALLGGVLNGLTSKLTGGHLGGGANILTAPLGIFSNLVGHDSAAKAAANGDIGGWLVNTFDHSGHSHALGGAAHGGSSAPLGFLGTIGQEAGGLIGLDKIFGSALEYDRQNGTNYAQGGNPNYGILGNIGGHAGHH